MPEQDSLRVAMIIQSYLPRLGGAEKQLAEICRRLRKKGIEPVIITRRYAGMSSYEMIAQTPVYRVPAPQPKALAAFCYILFGLAKVGKIDPQVIHAHELLSPTDMAILAGQIWKKPVAVKVLRGGKLGDLDKLHHRGSGEKRIQRIKRNVDMFIAISCEIDRELAAEGIPGERRRFLPNGVDIDFYKPVPDQERDQLRRKLDLPHGFLCVYSGRLATEKGLTFLLQAWERIAQRYAHANLLILGSGEMQSSLHKAAGKNVTFGGYVTETCPYYQAADAFILPSETEGLSNALLEAMACGLPAIATWVGAAADLIESGKDGLLVPPRDADAIVQALEDLIDHPHERGRMGAAGRERICRDYSLERTANGLVDLYRELAGKEPRP